MSIFALHIFNYGHFVLVLCLCILFFEYFLLVEFRCATDCLGQLVSEVTGRVNVVWDVNDLTGTVTL